MGELTNPMDSATVDDLTWEGPTEAITEPPVETTAPAEETTAAEDSTTQEDNVQDNASQEDGNSSTGSSTGTGSGDAASGDTDSGSTTSADTDSGDANTRETVAEETSPKETAPKETTAKETTSKETTAKETTSKDSDSQSGEFDSSGSGSSGLLVTPAEDTSGEETTGENSSASASEATTEETSAGEAYTETQAPVADTGSTPLSGGMLYAILGLLLVLIIGVALTIIRKNNEKKRRRRRKRAQAQARPRPKSDDLITAVGTDPTLATVPIAAAPAAVHQPVVAAVHQHIGAREDQQDSYGASDLNAYPVQGVLGVVADGMGGLSNGGAVSSALVHTFLDGFRRMAGQVQPQDMLLEMAIQANGYINQMLRGAERSGSTLVSAVIRDGYLHFLTVGDSRIYLYRSGTLLQLNREHIYQEELAVKAVNRLISIPQVSGDRQAHSLTSYFGIGQIPSIDRNYEGIKLVSGDRILLATDGVFGTLTREQMEQALQGTVGEAAKAIGDMVREADQPYQDNNTALILEYRG